MFPVPVGPTNAASQQFGSFRQAQDERRRQEENPDEVANEEKQREDALAHEIEVEDDVDAAEQYDNTKSIGAASNASLASFGSVAEPQYPSMKGAFAPLAAQSGVAVPLDADVQADTADTTSGATIENVTMDMERTLSRRGSQNSNIEPPTLGMERVYSKRGSRNANIEPTMKDGERTYSRRSSDNVELGRLRSRQGSVSVLAEDTLHLGAIKDEDIRRALDPVSENFSVKDLMDWPEEKLMRLVDHVQPQHLPVLMNNRLQVHEKESAKNLSFHNINYVKNGETVLHDVNGYMESGMMIGVLGAPDSGITPLFDVLTGRHQGGTLTGDILYDGKKRTADFTRWMGYVVKEDPHLAHMTVFETLYFSARLRLPDMPAKIVRMRVAITLKLLGLSHVQNTVVGDGTLRGISGGEKRRVSFGIEMVAGHACIIADLPTNGLDSASAYSLIRTMRFATKIGFSMMASIVQPSPQMLRLFHRVMVMSKGTIIYFGPVGQSEEFFRNAGFIRPAGKALPQFLEEVTLKPELFYQTKRYKEMPVAGVSDETNDRLQIVVQRAEPSTGPVKWGEQTLPNTINRARYDAFMVIYNAYKSSVYAADVKQVLDEQIAINRSRNPKSAGPTPHVNGSVPVPDPVAIVPVDPEAPSRGWGPIGKWWYRHYNSSPGMQLWMNLYRQSVLSYRNTGLWRDTWLTSLCMGFFLGSLFYRVGTDYEDIRNRVGLFFFILSYLAFNAVMLVPVLSHQRDVYYNQLAGGYYHGFPYYIAHFIVNIPIVAVETFLLLVPVWGLANLTGPTCGHEFWYAYLILAMNSLISRVWMILLASVSPNEVYADVLNTVTNIIFTKLCGYFVPANFIVRGWYWMYLLSYFTYALRGLAKVDVWGIQIPGCCNDPLSTDCPYQESLALSTPDNVCYYANGKQALYYIYDIDPDVSKWSDFVDLIWFLITFNFGAMIASTYVNWRTLDEPEHPDFGTVMEKKHRELHSDITKSSSRRIPKAKEISYQPTAPQQHTLALDVPQTAEEDAQNEEANQMTYNHKVTMIDPAALAKTRKTKKAYLEFKDLCYEVLVGKHGGGQEPRMLLNKVFGYAKPGTMTALMGASGAGKSTLLDVLAGKKTGGTISGDIRVNGLAADYKDSFSRIAGYVEQFDSHNAFSTVREAVKFSGRLRLPRKTTAAELDAKVDQVLEVLGISHLANRLIGSPGFGGVSMEVRKKCTIAVELIMEPALLFLDEPTTGLDSAGAYAVLTSMQLLAEGQGMTVVCTIHQPSAELAMMFDNLLLMMPGGHVAYFGGFAAMPAWFAEHHLGELQAGQNPADFALDAVKKAQTGKNSLNQDINMVEEYKHSPEARSVIAELDAGLMPEDEQRVYVPPVLAHSQPNLFNQWLVLNERFFWSYMRNTSYIGIRMFLSVFMGFVVGTVFLRLGWGQDYADQRLSAIFVVLVFVMFTANAYVPDIFFLRSIYFRETGSKMYNSFAFYMGRFTADIPIVLAEIFLLCVMVYFICDLNPHNNSEAFGMFYLTMLGVRWVSVFFTWALGAAVELPTNANTLQSTYFNLQMVLTGFIIPGPSMHIAWVWLRDLTYCYWAFAFLAGNEARNEVYTCWDDELIPVIPGEQSSCEWSPHTIDPFGQGHSFEYKCRFECGKDLLDMYGFEWTLGWLASYEVILWCFGIFFAILAAFTLAYINHIKR